MSWPQCVILACILFYWLAGSRSILKDRKISSVAAATGLFIWLALCVLFAVTLRAGGFW